MKNILIVDDEEKIRTLLGKILKLEGFFVHEAKDIQSALKKNSLEEIHLIICDVKLPDGNGIDFIQNLKQRFPDIEVITLTAFGNVADAVKAIKHGAFDYIVKGDDNNRIIPLVHRAFEKIELTKKIKRLEKNVSEKHDFSKILGKSKSILAAIELAKKVAATETTILLTGETGTGKEIFANAIHFNSSRRDKNFVAINCAAFSKELLESELFGFKSGSFTGASSKDKKGLFEEANEGTLFLDEIGELHLELQAKLLRVIETGEFYKIGNTKPTHVNVRIIAATNKNLKQETELNQFRSDLMYRLSVFEIKLPALKDRTEDIEILADYFLKISSLKINRKINGFTNEYLTALKKYHFPGNIRELKNIIERSIIIAESDSLDIQTLPKEIKDNDNQIPSASMHLSEIEKMHIKKVLEATNGNKTEAAHLLGIGISTLYRKIEEYKIV